LLAGRLDDDRAAAYPPAHDPHEQPASPPGQPQPDHHQPDHPGGAAEREAGAQLQVPDLDLVWDRFIGAFFYSRII